MARIMIVDDSRTSRKVLRSILEECGHEVVFEATNGEEGYLKFKELKPDLVTMDITMPKMDGIECLKLIHHADENAKVIMVTAAGQKDKVMEAVKYGALEFLSKPFDEEAIKKTIQKIIQ
ncbi:MAG: response regulator [Blautia sp.]|nr:response regulator [Blautia sp.]